MIYNVSLEAPVFYFTYYKLLDSILQITGLPAPEK